MDPLWITYAWKDEDDGDFSYLIQELEAVGVEVTYDKIALVPGRRLWEQIGQKITQSPLCGWASLLTPNSLNRPGCREELEYALNRALSTKGEDFPLIGLLHGVLIEDVPPPLAIRLCVDLGNPNWKEEVLAGVEGRPPKRQPAAESRFVWSVHRNYGGIPSHVAVEVRPHFGTMMYWRLIVPASSTVVAWGLGPAGGGAILGMTMMAVEGQLTFQSTSCAFFGSGDALSPSVSAYVVFEGQPPSFVGFGQAQEPLGTPSGDIEVISLSF